MIVNKSIVSVVGLMSVTIIGASSLTNTTHAASYSTSISTSGSVSLNVGMNGNGANIATDNVKVVSTCPAGYNVGIAATSATNASFNDTTLYKDGNTANNASSQKILSSTGTKDTPVSILNDNKKTWGYSIANNTTIHSDFIGLTTTQAILTTSATGTTATGIDLPVYYGASVDDAIEPGEYKMSDNAVITYYLTANLDCTSYQVAFNPTSIFEGNTITGTGTMSNQRIGEGVATPLDANGFTAPSGYYFAGWNTAQDGTGTSYAPGASVTDLTTAGNTITLYAQWTDCPGGKICYKENGTNVEGTMGQTTVNNTATSATLLASNFSRTGYGFAGWSDVADWATNPNAHFYGTNEIINFEAGKYSGDNQGLIVYAVWVKSTGNLQGWNGCSSLTPAVFTKNENDESDWSLTADLNSSITALTDTRDNDTYAVARLSDGNCWMIENLRLDDTAQLTTVNTNNPLNNGTRVTLKHNYTDTTTYNTLSPSSIDTTWCNTQSVDCIDQSRLDTSNTTDRSVYTNGQIMFQSNSLYSYGNYYNWYSATAGRGTYSTGSNATATGDLCPMGWHLPTGTGSGEFGILSNSLGGVKNANGIAQMAAPFTTPTSTIMDQRIRHFPNNFVYADSAAGSGTSIDGRYWTSTAGSESTAYYFYFYHGNVHPGTYDITKHYGIAIRCLMNP